jgi:hypothetical protein
MTHHRRKKTLQSILAIVGAILFFSALTVSFGWLDSPLAQFITALTQRQPKPSWPSYFRQGGMFLLVLAAPLLLNKQLLDGFHHLMRWSTARLKVIDRWSEKKFEAAPGTEEKKPAPHPLSFNHWDALIILFFLFIAFVYQLAVMRPGFPTVILGGDAANIASFAAGRAYPDLFKSDAILGDLNNIGLYVTIHLPLAIWLEKWVGNFGLAYSLLVLPHVFLQYFSYYLFGRVLYRSCYWAFLFSLAVSAPLALDGGELWGVMSDAMPRFTFQVLIPFILILLLFTWRDQPRRWYWIMITVGLLAFVHPVSTPIWAFALWLGFWPMFPPSWDTRRKIQDMFKLGFTLALALLPYVIIYLTYHKSGSSQSNYDLVHHILVEYFPANILNIPGAINTLFYNTAQFGLLWYGSAGLLITGLLFRSERPRLKQMLVWMAGIAFISILVPWVEITIERALRLIPLQTELMRGMRYLVLFLFIFWFYPFAELTRRSRHVHATRAAFAIGTLLTLGWLTLNPPQPFLQVSPVFNCWERGRFICPTNTDHADALTYIREQTPEGSKFTVFLANRWSGIEVRYLGLRPMVYAFKDRGQLLYTNPDVLQQWYSYQELENDIFSRRKSPTLEEKCTRIVEFARHAGADYILTNFECPPALQLQLHVSAAYQNSTYSVLKSNAIPPK